MRVDHIVTIEIFVDVSLDVMFYVSNDEQLILMLLFFHVFSQVQWIFMNV